MKTLANINSSALRLTAGLLMVLLFVLPYVQYFHHHEDQNVVAHSESEHHSQAEDCAICDYFLHKHSDTFPSAEPIDFKLFAVLAYIFLFEIIKREIKVFKTLPSNKAPLQLS